MAAKQRLVSSKAELKRREKQKKKAKLGGFESLGLSLSVFGAIKRKGYIVPTPIQRKTMPLILAGNDVVAMARTGSGKTAAFLVPMIERLKQHLPQSGVRALILSPTRDLALQTLKFANDLSHFTDLRISLLVGGDRMESQFEELAQSPDIIIATPGRLMHLLSEVEDMSLRTVEYVVFDEADSLFGMGFAEQLHMILGQLSENRQTLLFSATLPSALAEFAKAGLRDPQLVRLEVPDPIEEVRHQQVGRVPGDTALKILMQKVRSLDLNLSVLERYLEELTSKYGNIFKEIDKDIGDVDKALETIRTDIQNLLESHGMMAEDVNNLVAWKSFVSLQMDNLLRDNAILRQEVEKVRETQTSVDNKNVSIFVVCISFALLAVVRLFVDMAASVYKAMSTVRTTRSEPRKFCSISSSWLFLLFSCIVTFFILSL